MDTQLRLDSVASEHIDDRLRGPVLLECGLRMLRQIEHEIHELAADGLDVCFEPCVEVGASRR